MARVNYTKTIKLMDKGQTQSKTYPSSGAVSNGDLTNWIVSMQLTNSTGSAVDTCRIVLRTDPAGTFIRTGPILIDENSKYKYLIEAQISQGSTDGKLFRFEISSVELKEDQQNGEILVVSGRGLEYILKETLDSERIFFKTPKMAFMQRLQNYTTNSSFGFAYFDSNGKKINEWEEGKGYANNDIVLIGTQAYKSTANNNYAIPSSGVNWTTSAGSITTKDQTISLVYSDSDIALPDNQTIKQSYATSVPKSCFDRMQVIIQKLSQSAQTGGTLTDYYWDTNPDTTYASKFHVFAKAYGDSNSTGGLVTISPLDIGGGEQIDKSWIMDNERFKNLAIVKGAGDSGSLPMDHCRFRSDFLNATFRPQWISSGTYTANESYVRHEVSGQDKFYKCIQSSSSSNPKQPDQHSSYWTEDVVATASKLNPWLANRDNQIRSLAMPSRTNATLESGGSGFVGFAPDFNFVKGNYDRNFNNEYEHITLKWVTRISNSPPTGKELFHGQRILVGDNGSGDFNNKDNRIAQYDRYPDSNAVNQGGSMGTPVWRFSDAPQEKDLVVNLDTGEILRYNNTTKWAGASYTNDQKAGRRGNSANSTNSANNRISTQKAFSLQDHNRNASLGYGSAQSPAPLHLVKDIQVVEGATKGVNSAIKWTFDWDILGDTLHANSRGCWWWMMFPYPRLDWTGVSGVADPKIGSIYGSNKTGASTTLNYAIPYLDINNVNTTSHGKSGWNHGKESEDLGRIQSLNFKIKMEVDHLVSGSSELVPTGFANTEHIIWFVDIFDRIAYTTFKLKRNGAWQNIKVNFNSMQLHHNRLNEMQTILGFDWLGDFYLPQREYSGVAFDWRFVKGIGIQWMQSYAKTQFKQYNGWQLGFQKDLLTTALDGLVVFSEYTGGMLDEIIEIARMFDPTLYDIDNVSYCIDEFYFGKDLYVASSDEEEQVIGARTDKIVDAGTVFDYNTAKGIARGSKLRSEFFPQDYTITAFGDVRVRVGDKIRIKGVKVPSPTTDGGVPYFDVGVKEVKHIIDASSYKMVISGTRKFVA